MNNKKVKRFLGCVCALTLLLGSIPVNGIVASAEDETEQTYVNVLDNENFAVHGVEYDAKAGIFARMDLKQAAGIAGVVDTENYDFEADDTLKLVNNVYTHAREAAGGRIRFSTDSSYIAIQATLQHWATNYAKSMGDGKYGFDVYEEIENDGEIVSTYIGTLSPETTPTATGEVTFTDSVTLGDAGTTRHLTIYFPITTETKSVEIGVAEGCTIEAHGLNYTDSDNRILFYGSSITQGGVVSKPGNTYVNTVGRNLNRDYLNLGVWGSCKGQAEFAKYMTTLGNISAFVLDYDHNNGTVEGLSNHYAFYDIIRNGYEDETEGYADIPIIIITRPGVSVGLETATEMKAVIYDTYQRAVAAGDTNVHFIDGESFFGYDTQYLPDGVHPNDAGQARMAAVVTDVLERAFAGEENICIAPDCDEVEPTYSYDFEQDTLAEDGVDNSGATDWTVNLQKNTYSDPKFDVITEDGNNVFQLQYKRVSSSVLSGAISDEISLNDTSDFSIEMKATAYKNNRWPYIGLGIIDSQNDNYRLDVRIIPDGTGCQVACFDRTDGKGDVAATGKKQDVFAVGCDEVFEFGDLSNQYDDTQGTFTYNLKVEVETADIPSNDGKEFLLRVYVGYQESEGQEPVYQQPVVFKVNPANTSFSPEKLGLFMMVNGNGNIGKVTVDDLNVYTLGEHTITSVAEVPTTTEEAGKDAHYVCSSCGQLYLDANGILKTTDDELTNAKLVPCATIFQDDFSSLTNSDGKDNWTAYNCTVDNSTGALVIKHDGTENQAYIAAKNSGLLSKATDFGFKVDATIYKDTDNDCWTYMGVMFRQSGTTTVRYEIRIKPLEDGYAVQLYVDGKYVKSKVVDDEKFASLFADGTEISYRLRVIVDTDDTEVKFYVYVDNNDVVMFEHTPTTIGKPTGTRVMLYSTGEDVLGHKVAVDNMEAYYTTHKTSYVAEVPATETTTGTKAHYKCSVCDQKFLDEACTIAATDAELETAKLELCATLYTNDCKQTTHYQEKNGATVDNTGETLVIYGGTTEQPYIIIGDPNDNSAKIMTDAKSNFSFKMDSISYKDSNGNWTYAQVGFRRTGVGIYGVQIIPTSTGYTVQLCWNVDDSILGSIDVVDDRFASLYASGTEISYKLCVVSEFDSTGMIGDFHIYVDDNYVETFSVERTTAWKPDTARIYLQSTGTDVIGHQVSIDNIEVYKTTHDNVTAVEATPSTNDVAGVKAHYACSDCEKKFMDEAATIIATDADLAYWKLSDVLCQTRDNKTDSSIKDVRFVAYVDDYTKYSGVMFTITCGDKTGSATTTNVYQRIYAGGELYATQDLFGVTTGYFATFVLSNTSQALRDQGMTVTATWIPADGSEPISNDSRTIAFPQ